MFLPPQSYVMQGRSSEYFDAFYKGAPQPYFATLLPSNINNNNMMSPVMSPILPDLRTNAFGICSPSSNDGYSCAFPSWPNRPWLDGRRSSGRESPPSRQQIPLEFLESLRHRALPEQCFDDDDDDEDDENNDDGNDDTRCAAATSAVSDAPSTSSVQSSASESGFHHALPPADGAVRRSNSLLSRGFSQLRREAERSS